MPRTQTNEHPTVEVQQAWPLFIIACTFWSLHVERQFFGEAAVPTRVKDYSFDLDFFFDFSHRAVSFRIVHRVIRSNEFRAITVLQLLPVTQLLRTLILLLKTFTDTWQGLLC